MAQSKAVVHSQAKGAIRRYADGGMVGAFKRLVGIEKEDPKITAYKAQMQTERAAEKAASPAPVAAPGGAIAGYAGMTALQRREKEAGLKDGGMVKGPGTGTSDSIRKDIPEGSFIMPADSTKKIGLGAISKMNKVPTRVSNGEFEMTPEQVHGIGASVLMAMKDATHTPTGKPDTEDGMRARRDGTQEDDLRRARMVAQIPSGPESNPAPAAQPSSFTDTEFGRNVSNTLAALPGAGPLSGGAGAAIGAMGLSKGAGVGLGATRFGGPIASLTGKALPYGVPAAGAIALSNASSPDATAAALPNATRVNQSAPTPQPTTTTQAPAVSQGVPQASTTAPAGQVTRVGNSYSGENVRGDVNFVDKAGGALPARGGFMSIPAGGGGGGMGGVGGGDPALFAARMAAVQRGDTESVRASYDGNFAGKTKADYPIDAIMNDGRPMTTKKLGAIAQLQQSTARTQQDAEASQLARDRFGLDKVKSGLESEAAGQTLAASKQLQQAQKEYLAAKGPEEQIKAAEKLRILQVKQQTQDTWKSVALQGSTNAAGEKTEGVLAAVNERTGEMRRFDPGTAANTQLPPQSAMDYLKSNPAMAAQFDAKYGAGSASKVLGKK